MGRVITIVNAFFERYKKKKQLLSIFVQCSLVSHLLTEEYCNLFNFLQIVIDQVELLITKKGVYV